MARVLIVDDDASVIHILNRLMTVNGHETVTTTDSGKAVELLESEEFDIMLSDIRMRPFDGIHLLKVANASSPGMPVVLITAYASVATAVEALRVGAFDYVPKPLKVSELVDIVDRALECSASRARRHGRGEYAQVPYGAPNLVAASQHMVEVCRLIQRVALTDATVMIRGEFGVGKAAVARAIHEASVRNKKKFVVLSCGELPEPMLDAAITGHLDNPLFMVPAGDAAPLDLVDGTIFLEDVDSLPESVQAKMAAAFAAKSGGGGSAEMAQVNVTAGVRFLASTTVDITRAGQEKRFDGGLLHRLSLVTIEIKPLRERREDILPLALHMLQPGPDGEEPAVLADDARDALLAYDWPGNVSELKTALTHGLTAAEGGPITKSCLPETLAVLSASQRGGDKYRGRALKKFLSEKLSSTSFPS